MRVVSTPSMLPHSVLEPQLAQVRFPDLCAAGDVHLDGRSLSTWQLILLPLPLAVPTRAFCVRISQAGAGFALILS